MRPLLRLHIGTNKTGTTAIQSALASYRGPGPEILVTDDTLNSARTLNLAFRERPLRRLVPPGADLAALRAKERARFSAVLAASDRPALMSSEVFTAISDGAGIDAAVSAARAHAAELRVLVYVRPPRSYVRSLYQQSLKARPPRADVAGFVPRYRDWLGPWLSHPGVDAAEIVGYRPPLVAPDAILRDFAGRCELDPDALAQHAAARNRGMSLEAAAVLTAWYASRPETGPGGAPATIPQPVAAAINGFGDTLDWGFAGPAFERAIAAASDQTEWIAQLAGEPGFADEPGFAAAVEGPAELARIGEGLAEPLAAWLSERHGVRADPARGTPALIDALAAREPGAGGGLMGALRRSPAARRAAALAARLRR